MPPAERHVALNAHLLTAQAGYRSAGINGYIAHLLRALPGVDASLRYTVFAGPQAPVLDTPRLSVRRSAWRTERPLARIVWEQIAQPLALAQTRPDLVHQLAFVAPIFRRSPFVVTVYDLSFVHFPERLPAARRLYLRTLARRSCQQARRVIAISRSTAADLTATWGIPAAKIDLALPGVDEAFRPLPRAEVEAFRTRAGLPERFLLYLGTLEPRKNLPLLLRAYAALPASDRAAAPLVLAGGRGWMGEEIERALDAYELRASVLLPGYVPADDLPLWYNAADALVYPSLFEGFGLPVIEAMACGTPALVAETSSLPEAVGSTGRCLPPDDADAWTGALAQVLHDAAWRAEMGARARARAREFTWARTAAQTVASYRRALGLAAETG